MSEQSGSTTMNLYPLELVADHAQAYIAQGAEVFQIFLCQWCGAKNTMARPNIFHLLGVCQACQQTTDIAQNGCNTLVVFGSKFKPRE